MSYVLSPFLVDLERLRRAIGSRDESLIAAVIDRNPGPFEIPAEDVAGQISPGLALRHLVMGDDLEGDSAAQYGLALELLCGHLGEEILPDAWGGVRWEALEATGLDDLMTRSGPPIPLPAMPGFPVIARLAKEDVASQLARLADARPVDDDEDLEELLEEFRGWLGEAVAKKTDVVFFYR